jgi:hypothetical protein
MNEEIYKAMKRIGGFDIVLGIVSIAAGVALGVLAIVNGARLLKKKSQIMF